MDERVVSYPVQIVGDDILIQSPRPLPCGEPECRHEE
jgi:hypothetical protein